MRERGAEFFSGRDEQIQAFEFALDAIDNKFQGKYKSAKTAIAISGEGGMGKTTLLWEYERVCRRRDIKSICFDFRRQDELHGIIDFMAGLRRWLPKS